MHPAGLTDFKQYCNNSADPVCNQLASDLFCFSIDNDSTKRTNVEQIVH